MAVFKVTSATLDMLLTNELLLETLLVPPKLCCPGVVSLPGPLGKVEEDDDDELDEELISPPHFSLFRQFGLHGCLHHALVVLSCFSPGQEPF